MSICDLKDDVHAIERCADELMQVTDPVADRFSSGVYAAAMGVHLACLLRALREAGACTPAQIRTFYRRFEREALASDKPQSGLFARVWGHS
jgi:hypothetical protein